jgi:aspartokinase
MTSQKRLSAFKILKEVVRISLVESDNIPGFPADICNLIAEEGINLMFLTCGSQGQGWGLNMAVEADDSERVLELIESKSPHITCQTARNGIISLFPHRSDPSVTGSLFHVLDVTGIEPEALAYSNSSISVVLHEAALETTTSALFEPFKFSAYRTPADWKLAQEGKEQLFKEVVASYQEKKPKVYSLEWQKDQNLFRVKLNLRDLSHMGDAFINFARQGFLLPFLTSCPSATDGELNLSLCVPNYDEKKYPDLIKESLPEAVATMIAPVAVFSMNGPHFGDRYGIANELLKAFRLSGVELLALGCAIASINGVVPAAQLETATSAIEQCFEVPSIIIKPVKTV